MIQISQFRRKLRRHGVWRTCIYTTEYVVRPLWRRCWLEPVRRSYSQRDEDRIIDAMLGNKVKGTYLDVGAFAPRELSNTKRFYDRGWRGCNVEPSPARFAKFVDERPDDLNLNVGLAATPGALPFYLVTPAPFSTFSSKRADELRAAGATVASPMMIPVITLSQVFADHIGGAVDFCSIDTEGMDLDILKGNDWSRFRPRVICVEAARDDSDINAENSTSRFLEGVGYAKLAQTFEFGEPLNEIYARRD